MSKWEFISHADFLSLPLHSRRRVRSELEHWFRSGERLSLHWANQYWLVFVLGEPRIGGDTRIERLKTKNKSRVKHKIWKSLCSYGKIMMILSTQSEPDGRTISDESAEKLTRPRQHPTANTGWARAAILWVLLVEFEPLNTSITAAYRSFRSIGPFFEHVFPLDLPEHRCGLNLRRLSLDAR